VDKIINKKIAEWLGFKVIAGSIFLFDDERGWYRDGALPDYATSDVVAVTLLPVLVEKGHGALLTDDGCKRWDFTIWVDMTINEDTETVNTIEVVGKATIAEAISAAVVKLIESI